MQKDTPVFDLLSKELKRQREGIELIASENFTSMAVMQAMGSVATNKYAEGYPGKRYYGGCEIIDEIERLAIDRLKNVFNATWANVQPHSGAQANFAVFLALLQLALAALAAFCRRTLALSGAPPPPLAPPSTCSSAHDAPEQAMPVSINGTNRRF